MAALESLGNIHLDCNYTLSVLTDKENSNEVITNEHFKKRQRVPLSSDLYIRNFRNEPLNLLIYRKMCEQHIISGTALQIHPDLKMISENI